MASAPALAGRPSRTGRRRRWRNRRGFTVPLFREILENREDKDRIIESRGISGWKGPIRDHGVQLPAPHKDGLTLNYEHRADAPQTLKAL